MIVTIIDYGMGNMHSIVKAFHRLEIPVEVTSDPANVLSAEKLVLPGVGHFKNGMEKLRSSGLFDVLNQRVLVDHIPILGICLGAQLFTNHSEEGDVDGLRWIPASTTKFVFSNGNQGDFKIPHIGWNQLSGVTPNEKVLNGIDASAQFYFVHSYYIKCQSREHAMAETVYGHAFDAIIKKDNIIGVQFHPEKSHTFGLKLLHNFATL